jgi:Right handed beta helix region
MKRLMNTVSRMMRPGTSPRQRVAKTALRGRLESLEERAVPATFTVYNNYDSGGPGTFRDAIEQSNAHPYQGGTLNVIQFKMVTPSTDIYLQSDLPPITAAVVINGYTQSGAHPNTAGNGENAVIKVGLFGDQPGTKATTGLRIEAYNVTVEGMKISDFQNYGMIVWPNAGSATIKGNIIAENGLDGILMYSSDNMIGGTSQDRNMIWGNGGYGIKMGASPGAMPQNNTVQGNWIGLTTLGAAAGNALGGIEVGSIQQSDIYSNVIAYNSGSGVMFVGGGAAFNHVHGNDISHNFGDGVDLFYGAHDNYVYGNAIHNNNFDGVLLRGGTGNYVGLNSIYANSEAVGLMQGANQGISTPALTGASHTVAGTTVSGQFHGKANSYYEIDFYGNPDLDYYRDQGMTVLGSIVVKTDVKGNATFVAKLAATKAGDTVTAQAQGEEGSSALSLAVKVTGGKPLQAPPGQTGVGVGIANARSLARDLKHRASHSVFQALLAGHDQFSGIAGHWAAPTQDQASGGGKVLDAALDAVHSNFAELQPGL